MSNAIVELHPPKTERELVVVLCADADSGTRIAYWLDTTARRAARAADGYHAADILKAHHVDAIITDRVLPPWPGLDAFPRLRKSHPDLQIIFIETGEPVSTSLAWAAGATQVLRCPLRRQSVLDAVPSRVAAA